MYSGKRSRYSSIFASYFKRLVRLQTSNQYNFIWLEKELFPWIPSWVELLVQRSNVPYIIDYDDAIFHQYDQNPSPLIRGLLGKKIDQVMKHSALVIAGNDYLADRAYRAGAKKVEIIPTVIDSDRYLLYEKKERKILKIGWIGSPSTAKYVKQINTVLTAICRDYNAKVVLIGAGKMNSIDFPVEHIEWSYETEVKSIQELDIGIMPLLDSDWEKGKCGLKIIQYMACYLPVVASPVGVNTEIVDHGFNGFLAKDESEWYLYLSQLLTNNELRYRMGQRGRNKVEQHYSLQITTPKLTKLLKQVVRG